jgi:hypothetical protein
MPDGGTGRAVLPRTPFEHGAVRCSTFKSGLLSDDPFAEYEDKLAMGLIGAHVFSCPDIVLF